MLKENVLEMLRESGGHISGQEIAKKLGVSRMAVSNAVKALRAEAYEIESATNRGYRLVRVPDRLGAAELGMHISPERMEKVICLDSVDSTNKKLRALAAEGAPDRQIVVAGEQTGGLGRSGRSFSSPKDKGIYFSILFRPGEKASSIDPTDTAMITAWTAVAVSRAIERVCGVRPGIKWVNDLVLNRKKICGILTELSLEAENFRIQYLIIGIGVNTSETPEDFPEDIRKIASSITEETGREVSRAALAGAMARELDRMLDGFPGKKAEYLEEYRRYCISAGCEVKFTLNGQQMQGRSIAVNEDFSLNIETDEGRNLNVSQGEVSVRGLYGYV